MLTTVSKVFSRVEPPAPNVTIVSCVNAYATRGPSVTVLPPVVLSFQCRSGICAPRPARTSAACFASSVATYAAALFMMGNSFVVILVKLVEPKTSRWAEKVTLPVFGEVAKDAVWVLKIRPDDRMP